ncbi:MAG TPA: GNAT family N-acetyltransferase [Polyangia bacterium]|jgi:L-amino acid N-acyltransferase YncA|nr:GNAT family N-acetyltransferase [Polyangia bacterium]
MDLRFSVATNQDWPAIWEVFREVVASGDTYMFSPEIDEADARVAWMPDGTPRRVTYVAWLDGVIVGTALLKPNASGLGDHVANAGWMVAPAASGRGVGRRFAQHVLDEARGLGFRAMQFNAVVATNERAIGLWKSIGFEIVGTVPDAFRHATHGLTDIHIMYCRLS